MVKTGFSAVIGSWNTIEILLPLTCRISGSGSDSRSLPLTKICPERMRPGGSATRRMIESAVALLPEHDSPTTPSVAQDEIEKETSSTARKLTPSEENCVLRC